MIVTQDALLTRWLRLHNLFGGIDRRPRQPPRPRPRHDGPAPVEPDRPPILLDGAAAPLEFDE